jgi:hypothetical protein
MHCPELDALPILHSRLRQDAFGIVDLRKLVLAVLLSSASEDIARAAAKLADSAAPKINLRFC